MIRSVIAGALICGIVGCTPDIPEPTVEAPPLELTAERARDALIDLIRSTDPGVLKDFPLERFIGDGIEGGADSPAWGPFFFHLKDGEYSYSRTFGQPPRVCRWEYRGRFELRAGRWVALPPRVESQALGAE